MRRRRGERGTAVVEFALSFMLLFTLFTGAFRLGYAFYVYNTLQSAVRGGARYASLRTYDSSTSTPSSEYMAAVQKMVLYGDPNGGSVPVAAGLTLDHVDVKMTMDRNVPKEVAVSIDNFTIDALFTSIRLTGKPNAVFPYMGRYAP